jgi:hypothetical protein
METGHNIESILKDSAGNPAATTRSLYQTLKSGAKKAAKFVLSFIGLGAFDALHPKSVDSAAVKAGKWLGKYMSKGLQFFLPLPTQLYQAGLMSADFGASAVALHDPKRSKKENLGNMLTGPANAVGMDYSSASITAKKPLFSLPKADYEWRYNAFNHTAYSGLVKAVNAKFFGFLAGYAFGLGFLAAYGIFRLCCLAYRNWSKITTYVKNGAANIYNSLSRGWASFKGALLNGYTSLSNIVKQSICCAVPETPAPNANPLYRTEFG